jgi:hypothetical protein
LEDSLAACVRKRVGKVIEVPKADPRNRATLDREGKRRRQLAEVGEAVRAADREDNELPINK